MARPGFGRCPYLLGAHPQGVGIGRIGIRCEDLNGWLVQHVDPGGWPVDVVVRVDGPAFSEAWIQRVSTQPAKSSL